MKNKFALFISEWKKLIAQKNFWFMLGVFFALQAVFFVVQGFENHQDKNPEMRKLLNEIIAMDEQDEKASKQKLIADLELEKENHLKSHDWFSPEYQQQSTKVYEVNQPILQRVEYVDNFQANNETRISELNKKLILLKFDVNPTFSEQTFKRQIAAYQDLADLELQVDHNRGVDILRKMSTYNLISLVFIFWLATIIFKGDQDDDITGLIRSLPLGIKSLVRIKSLLLIVFGIGYALVTKLIQFGVIRLLYGFGNINRVIQSNQAFNLSALRMNIGQFILYDGLFFVLVSLFFVGISILFNGLFKKRNTEIYAVSLVFVISLAFYRFVPEFSIFNLLKFLNPIALIDFPIQIEVYKDLNLFGFVATRISVSIIAIVILTLISILLGNVFLIYGKQKSHKRRELKFHKLHYKLRTLLGFEIWHSLFKNKTIILLAIIVGAGIKLTDFEPPEINSLQRANYLSIINTLEGTHTEYKDYVLAKRIWELQNRDTNFAQQTQNQAEIIEAMRIQNNLAMMKDAHQKKSTTLYVMDEAKGNAWFNFSANRNLQAIPLVLFMVALSLALLGPDKKYNMMSQIRITPQGQKNRMKVQLWILSGSAMLANIIFTLILYLGACAKNMLLPLNAAIQSIMQLLRINLSLSFNGLEAILFFYRFFSLLTVGLCTYILIQKFDRVRTTIWLTSIFIILPTTLNVIFPKINFMHILPWANSISIYADLQYMSTSGFILMMLSPIIMSIGMLVYLLKISAVRQ